MYDEINSEKEQQLKMSEHEFIANEIADHICNFNPEQQNEMLKIIRQITTDRRRMKIEDAEKEAAYLRATLENL